MREQLGDRAKVIAQPNMINSAVKRPGQPHHEIRARANPRWPLTNPNGQWARLQEATGLPIAAAIAEELTGPGQGAR